ncbi:MAG: LysR family transcriptional regulator [Cyanobacteria bacterium J06559_3]
MVNLEWYRSFVEVYRIGTVSKAAEVLHLTQPAVSQHIAALEATLGEPLFQRQPRKMVPTETGKRLYTQVVVAIETLEAIPTKTSHAERPPLMRLGAPTEFFSEYVLQRLPKTENFLFATRFGLAQNLIEQLLADEIDCAIATQKISRPELDYQPILEESFWLVGPPNAPSPPEQTAHPSHRQTLESWLKSQSWVTYSEDLPIIRRFWRVVFGHRLAINPQVVIPDLRTIREAIAQGLGYSVLPDYLCRDWVANKQLTLILKPEKAVTNQIWLAYRKRERRSPKVSLLVDWLGID